MLAYFLKMIIVAAFILIFVFIVIVGIIFVKPDLSPFLFGKMENIFIKIAPEW